MTEFDIERKQIVDTTSTANITYIGYAEIERSKADDYWKIKVVDETSGVEIKFPQKNGKPSQDYSFVWNDRLTYTYS